MGFYALDKEERRKRVEEINRLLLNAVQENDPPEFHLLFSDNDTYIRKTAYLAVGKTYRAYPDLQAQLLKILKALLNEKQASIRQTAINAAGEIGLQDFESVEFFFNAGLFDTNPIVRNAVIGSLKKMSQKNHIPVLRWAKNYLNHPDKEIRREICHGIELRGRTHPEDILPLLKELQFDKTARVRLTLIHVIGQISYKKGCLETVIDELNHWENKTLCADALAEIISVHRRYADFAIFNTVEATRFIKKHYKNKN